MAILGRSAEQYSTRYGKIEDMVVGLDVALADGRLIGTGGGPRAAIVGSECTPGVITAAGGVLSHHHGIGLAKARLLPAAALGPAHAVVVDLTRALDPAGVLNPGTLGLPTSFGGPAWP